MSGPRTPLIFPSRIVIERFDPAATRAVNPAGEPTSGFDDVLQEPVRYTSGGVTQTPRQDMTEVIIPCQCETKSYEELQMVFTGNDPVTRDVFVLHRRDLANLNLIDATTGNCVLKAGDRIVRQQKATGQVVRTWQKPLYIYQVLPGSHGMGPDDYDLHMVYTTHRPASPGS